MRFFKGFLFIKFMAFVTVFSTLSGCAQLLQNRTFIDEMDHQTEGLFVAGRDFEYVPGDAGVPYRTEEEIAMRTPASEGESLNRAQNASIYKELAMRERQLTLQDRELYNEVRPYLETPSEKIYYLTLSPRERSEYLRSRRIETSEPGYNSRAGRRGLASLQPIYSSALELGMTKDQVLSAWGRPAKIDVAGNPLHENERWSFYENGRVRHVYFEGGAVQGWNIQ